MASTIPASTSNYTTSDETRNISWVQQAFLLTNENPSNPDIDDDGQMQRIFTTASFNYSDTSPGGNWAMNPAPQFCRFADVTMGGSRDIVGRGLSSSRTTMYTDGSMGEGRYYNEIIEGNAQYVTMSFGVPAFNSLTTFFGNFYNADLGTLTRTGTFTTSFARAIGVFTGTLLGLPFRPLVWISQLVKNALNIPSTSYAYFRPSMPLYWQAVTTMVNSITVNLGIHERDMTAAQKLMYMDPNTSTTGSGTSQDISGDIVKLNQYLPQIYSAWPDNGKPGTADSPLQGQRGGIDIYALAVRSQTLSAAFNKKVTDAINSVTKREYAQGDLQAAMRRVIGTRDNPSNLTGMSSVSGLKAARMSDALKKYVGVNGADAGGDQLVADMSLSNEKQVQGNQPSDKGGDVATQDGTAAPTDGGVTTDNAASATSDQGSVTARVANWFSKMLDGLKSDLQDGAQFVTFKVDYGGAIGESFGNSFRPSDLEGQINSKVSSARTAEYNMAGGNLVGGAIGATLKSITSSVTELVNGALTGLKLQGLNLLAGSAYVDIPKMFDSSSTNMPTQSFTIHLRSPYGHKLALLQNLYIPLALLLAGCLPRATGPASYNSPFVCQLFAKGRMQVRYGMITSLSVQRGTGNIGFTKEGLPLGIDISFEVTDFSSVLYMPILAQTGFLDKATMAVGEVVGGVIGGAVTGNVSSGAATGEKVGAALGVGMYSDDSIFSDYMAILSGLSFQSQLYTARKWSIAMDKAVHDYEMAKSPYHWGLMVSGSLPGRIISSLVRGTDRPG